MARSRRIKVVTIVIQDCLANTLKNKSQEHQLQFYVADYLPAFPTCVHLFIQALGVSSQSDRSTIKKKLKDMRKAQEKLEKQREKKEKEVRRSGKLPLSSDSVC